MAINITLESLADILRRIPTVEIDDVAKRAGPQWDADSRRLRIMVSSPLAQLSEERDEIKKVLSPYSTLDTQLFERMADSGHRNVRESMDLAQDCEMIIAIIDPEYLGSKIPPEERPTMAGYRHIEYYSELELQIAFDRNAKSRLPLIFLYAKRRDAAELKFQGWHKRFTDRIAPKWFATTRELIEHVYLDVIGNVIELRSARARYLSMALRETELQLSKAEHETELKTVETDSKSQQIATLKAAGETLSDEVTRVSQQLAKQDKRAVSLMRAGGVMTAVPVLLLTALLVGWYVFGGTNAAIKASGQTIASAAAYRPLHINGIPYDPMGLAAKITFARSLTKDQFTCDGPGRKDWPVDLDAAADVSINRDSVCLSTRELVLTAKGKPYENCEYEPPMNAAWWEKVLAAADKVQLSINEARLVGHASAARIWSQCRMSMSVDLFNKIPTSVRGELDIRDRNIRTNTQLAYARAKALEISLSNAGITAHAETLGILNAESSEDQSRRVTVALRLSPKIMDVIATPTLSAR